MAEYKFTNRLISETSPYLLQHAHNPVDWYPWGEDALEKAANDNKLIFLSIGYSSCHWCHVMAHESFEDESVAAYLNEHFVPIKVDREERPDLDNIYMEAVQLMTGQGGWPLNVWLTPNKIPIYGGTYFPPEDRYQRPGFLTVLNRLFDLYNTDPQSISQRVAQIQKALQTDLMQHVESSVISEKQLHDAAEAFRKHFDPISGGFGPAPKFPSAMGISFLFHYHYLFQDEQAKIMAADSLSHMIEGGIYDHIGGGFHRYSTDNEWLVPHFEKMLYDNGLLITALCDAFQVTGNEVFKSTVYETIDFLEREMMSPDGGFYSAIDADSENIEGQFYVWLYKELNDILTIEEFNVFSELYDITQSGNWEGKNIPNRIHSSRKHLAITEEQQKLIKAAKEKLLTVREQRARPGTDTKVITSWNALILKALCKACLVFGEEHWKQLALKNARFLLDTMFDGSTLLRTYNKRKAKQHGFLDDYALLAESLTYVFEISGDEYFLEQSIQLCDLLIELFHDPGNDAFYFVSDRHETTLSRPRDTFDNATPGGNSAAITALQRTGHLSGKVHFVHTARRALEKLAETASQNALSFGYFLKALAFEWKKGPEIIITGKNRKPFQGEWSMKFLPGSFFIGGDDFSRSQQPVLSGKKILNGKTTAYVCQNYTCKQPVTDLQDFRKLLNEQ